MKTILLASASPRRREILSMLGVDFEVCICQCDEQNDGIGGKFAQNASEIKAAAVEKDIARGKIIIAADTVVCIDGQVMGKPKDRADAENMLKSLSGRSHLVHTGFCIADGEKTISGFETTEVFFRKLSEADINWYIETKEWADKAGAYGIQGKGALLVEKIVGDYFNVVGLPVCRIFSEIQKL